MSAEVEWLTAKYEAEGVSSPATVKTPAGNLKSKKF
jgi:hypothetical protein